MPIAPVGDMDVDELPMPADGFGRDVLLAVVFPHDPGDDWHWGSSRCSGSRAPVSFKDALTWRPAWLPMYRFIHRPCVEQVFAGV
jgi:hypothetical protein